MVGGVKRLRHLGCATTTDLQQTIREPGIPRFPHLPSETFANCLLHCFGETLASALSQPSGEVISFGIFDTESHEVPFYLS